MRRARGVGADDASGSARATRPAGAADHVLWVDGAEAGRAPRTTAALVLRYHVLWELTHVCFEHPGLLAADDERACDDDAVHHLLRRGPLAEVVDGRRHRRGVGAHRRGVETDRRRTLVGPGRVPAISCSCTPAPPSRVPIGAEASP